MQTHRDIPFGDGIYTVRLGIKQILAIQEKCGAGIGKIYAQVMQGRYDKDGTRFGYGLQAEFSILQLTEICRQGLIGGGAGFVDGREITVSDHLASHLVDTYVAPDAGVPMTRAWDLAEVIMETAMSGYEPDQKKTVPKRRQTRKGGSTADRSSETAS